MDEQRLLNERFMDLCRFGMRSINRDISLRPQSLYTLNDVKELIDTGADINYQDVDGQSPLIILSRATNTNHTTNHNYNTCKFLLESGADVDIQNQYGNTALMHSIHDINIMKLLLEYDPDIYLVNVLNVNVLKMCEKSEYKPGLLEQSKLLEEYIEKKLVIVQKRLLLGKLFYSVLGKNLVEEGLYEQISLIV